MIPVYQTKFNNGTIGTGNCLSAALASILHLPIEEVPEFMNCTFSWRASVNKFLERFSLFILPLPYDPYYKMVYGFHLILGRTGTKLKLNDELVDLNHCVVGYNGAIVFNPMPVGGNVFEPFSIELLVKKHD